jgi:hypothetical protein
MNLVESQTAATIDEAFTIARFTHASITLGVVNPASASKSSTPRSSVSACRKIWACTVGPSQEQQDQNSP